MSEELAGLDVSRETMSRLKHFSDLLQKWTRKINLISPATTGEIWHRHFVDSAQLVRFVPTDGKILADLGTGGGLPAIVLAVILKESQPHTNFTMIKSDARKCAFLRTAVRELDLSATIINDRIDQVAGVSASVVTARALAPLSQLIPMVERHIAKNGVAILPKGKTHKAEIDLAKENWHMSIKEHPSLTDPDARILEIRNIARANL